MHEETPPRLMDHQRLHEVSCETPDACRCPRGWKVRFKRQTADIAPDGHRHHSAYTTWPPQLTDNGTAVALWTLPDDEPEVPARLRAVSLLLAELLGYLECRLEDGSWQLWVPPSRERTLQ